MARGSKSSYTSKQRRQARHIEESGEKRGMSPKRAASMAYATVNKQDGGGTKSGSGRGKKRSTASSSKGGRKSGRARRGSSSSSRGGSHAAHVRAGRKGGKASRKSR
jgi:hypothetical protein